MNLSREPLHNMLNLQRFLILAYRVFILIFTRQHRNWDRDLRCIGRIDHSRMDSCRGLERGALLAGQVHDLAAPAVANNAPSGRAALATLEGFEDLGNSGECLGRSSLVLEEGA